MSFVKYQNTNNASSLLIADITASQTTILITDGDQSLFPSSFPFLLTLEHLDANENVILREIVKAVSGNQNSFTVERSAGICVQDDTATNRVQDNTAHAFYSGDRISLYWTAEQVADIQNNLELKGNQDSIANVYDNTATYAVGDIVVYNGDRYTCTTAVSTPEDFDSTKWTKVNIQNELNDHETRIDALENAGGVAPTKVDVLVLAGGGGGGGGMSAGNWAGGGGGGAGGLKIVEGLMLLNKTFTVSVGSGGSGGTASACYGTRGNSGGNSSFGKLVAIGGGGGGGAFCFYNQCANFQALDGGNGGGMGFQQENLFNCPWKSIGMGMDGGNSGARAAYDPANYGFGGGGGGVGGPGGAGEYATCTKSSYRGIGGRGIMTCFGGTQRKIGGGGTGGGNFSAIFGVNCCTGVCGYCNMNLTDNGLCFGGGAGGHGNTNCLGSSATANTGGGGGGGFFCKGNGGAGGSGIVIVRYPKDCSYGIACATGGTITTPTINGVQYVVHTFTSSGTFCITQTA